MFDQGHRRALLGEGEAVVSEAAADVEDALTGDGVGIKEAVPAAHVERAVEVAVQSPEGQRVVRR